MDQVRAIELQNKKLKEIAFMQSHIIRAPVARIMGLSELIGQEYPERTEKTAIKLLRRLCKEFSRHFQQNWRLQSEQHSHQVQR